MRHATLGFSIAFPILVACAVGADTVPPAASDDPILAAGSAHYAIGHYDSAQLAWRAALARPDVAGSPSEARLHTWLGLASYRLGEYTAARELGERGLALATALELPADQARAENALGLLAWSEGRLTDASTRFGAALDGYRAIGDIAGVSRALNNQGLVDYDLGRFAAAHAAFTMARDSALAALNASTHVRAVINLGMWEIGAGDPRRGVAELQAAQHLATEAEDLVALANALGQLGSAHAVLGEPGLAIVALDSALRVARAAGLRDEEANNLVVIAGIYADAGDADRALRVLADARRINHDLGLIIEEGAVLREEAQLRAVRGALDLAERDARRALALHREARSERQEFHDRLLLVEIARRRERFAEAERELANAHRVANVLGSAQSRAQAALAEARLATHREQGRRALQTLDAILHDLDRAGAAAEAEAHALRLRAWMQLGHTDSAVASGHRAVEAIERVRGGFSSGMLRTSYVADRSRVYADLVGVLTARGAHAEAFAVADAARGRALLEHAAGATVPSAGARNVSVSRLAESERTLRRIDRLLLELAQAEDAAVTREVQDHLNDARAEYAASQARMRETGDDIARLSGARPAAAREVQARLAQDEVLLEYLVTTDRFFIAVIAPDTVEMLVQEIPLADLAHQVQLARDFIARAEGPDYGAMVLEALHEVLIRPVRDAGHLARARHLHLVPHGVLTYLPFAALRDMGAGTPLAATHSISYLPSASALPLLVERARVERSRWRVAGFAPFPSRLPATRSEVVALRLSDRRPTLFLDHRASEPAVRRALERGQVVHIASHGVMNARNPLFSRVELASPSLGGARAGSASDGRLEVHELFGMTVRSPLVFLSGCETGLGAAWSTAFDQGEDYATLAQAFLLAGAGGVLATLWRIDDEGAAAFAHRFYAHLGEHAPARALAAAQRDLLADPRWRSPHYWAAYTFAGPAN